MASLALAGCGLVGGDDARSDPFDRPLSSTSVASGASATDATADPVAPSPLAEPPSTAPLQTSADAPPIATLPPVAPPSTAPPLTPAPPAPSAPCGVASGWIDTGAGRRSLVRTDGLVGPAPMVVFLHGFTGSPTGIEKFSEFTVPALAAGVVVAYPEGRPVAPEGFGWASGAGLFAIGDDGEDDVRSIVALIDTMVGSGCVDPSRVVLVGESNGAGMSLAAACHPMLAGRLSAVVLAIPAVDDGVLGRCAPPRTALPIVAFAGLLDRTVPYLDGRGPLLPAETWFATAAASVNGCSSVSTGRSEGVATYLVGDECAACTRLVALADGPHTWPGSSRGTGGLTPSTYPATAVTLQLVFDADGACNALA